MATVTGFSCDFCSAFGASEVANSLPEGWMKLEIPTRHDVRDNVKHICSNKCLRDFGKARVDAEKPLPTPKPAPIPRPEPVDQKVPSVKADTAATVIDLTEPGRKSWGAHSMGHRKKGEVHPDCYYCDLDTTS